MIVSFIVIPVDWPTGDSEGSPQSELPIVTRCGLITTCVSRVKLKKDDAIATAELDTATDIIKLMGLVFWYHLVNIHGNFSLIK
jgi:hypothetical protein